LPMLRDHGRMTRLAFWETKGPTKARGEAELDEVGLVWYNSQVSIHLL
jgi:hypothetical protein